MNVDISLIAQWASGFIAIITFAKLIVQPFIKSMNKNNETMKSLEKAIENLNRDLADSQKDRENIHTILGKHGECIKDISEEQIRHSEQLKILAKERS